VKTMGSPFKMSQVDKEVFNPPPLLGQHNEEVICSLLGYSRNDLEQFKKENVI